jgi:hypothetical protein
MKKIRKTIVAKYKDHEIHLRVVRALQRADARRKWIFELIVTRLYPPLCTPTVVLKTQLMLDDDRPVEQVMTAAFVDSLVLCDARAD